MTRGLALVLAGAVAAAGCASDADVNPATGDGGGSGGASPLGCSVAQVTQPLPAAGPTSLVHAFVQGAGSTGLSYTWHVAFNGAAVGFTSPASGAIDFPVALPGVYIVSLDVSSAADPCPTSVVPVNIEAPGAVEQTVRLRVAPPREIGAPPMEKLIVVKGGGDADLGIVVVEAGTVTAPAVLGPGGGLAAYLQFAPSGAPDAIVEAFSSAAGAASVQLVVGSYAVLVVPSDTGVAPRRIAGWFPGQALELDAGRPVSGTVLRPGGQPLAGATVRLTSDGVPSTLPTTATTAADGSFALHAAPGATIAVSVTPPAASGLPRLIATSQAFDLGAPLQIQYSANVALIDLAGTLVRRAATPTVPAAPLPGARLTVVGTLPAVGMVTAGAAVVASGEVRIAATAGADGALPATLAPKAQLSAVIEAAAGDLAVVGFDATSGPPASLDAPAMQLITTAALDAAGAGLPGALVDLVPSGPLAMASAPALRLTAAASGVIATTLPAGGRYQLRFADPKRRAGPLVVGERSITAIAPSYALPRALQLQGTLRLDGKFALSGASVQILCAVCTGIERSVPLVEAVADATGRFALAVPDPGTR